MQTVSESDWRTVPQAERDKMDRIYNGDLAKAQAEERAAIAAYTDAQKTAAVKPPAKKPVTEDTAAAKQTLVQIEGDQAALRTATLDWRKHRVDAAHRRIELVMRQRELARARAVDAHTQGADSYDTSDFRTQTGLAQEDWWRANNAALEARAKLEHASAMLASHKEAYAQLMRNMPTVDNSARLRLSGWGITTNDTRRGFKITSAATIGPKTKFTPESWRQIGLTSRSGVSLTVR
jgi:hypothetical protein